MFPFPDNHFVQVGEDNHNGGGNQFFPDHDDYRDLLHAICLLPPAAINASSTVPSTDPSLPPDPSSTAKEASQKPPALGSRKRAVRKDRHSKIVTANGTRDRRMRLSLDVARKFFDLQDALHFDKPSKTVEWLLNKSKYAIESLAACSRPRRPARGSTAAADKAAESAYSSDCEVDSTSMIGNDGSNDGGIGNIRINSPAAAVPADLTGERAKSVERSNKQLPPRKAALHPAFVKESRAKARARARERTMEKKVLKQLVPPPTVPFSDSRDTRSKESEVGAPAQQVGGGTRQPETMAVPTAVAQSRLGEISIFDYKNNASSFGYLKERCIFETPSGGSWGTSN